ncbi:hypothetical protein [Nonomuraea solani]|uniref:hypothetical protein n=1 Tax=Nonomuraea solani TaxID=1144553 RepID=UPI000CDF188F|nr:hypothetical protein [Nonomuraea solani]
MTLVLAGAAAGAMLLPLGQGTAGASAGAAVVPTGVGVATDEKPVLGCGWRRRCGHGWGNRWWGGHKGHHGWGHHRGWGGGHKHDNAKWDPFQGHKEPVKPPVKEEPVKEEPVKEPEKPDTHDHEGGDWSPFDEWSPFGGYGD